MMRWIAPMVIAMTMFGCNARSAADPATPSAARVQSAMVGLWVTRWDFKQAADVRQVIADAASMGATDVFFQVRGQADAMYPSRLEPWSELLLDALPAGKSEPDFDPLMVAVKEAQQRGLKLHAWVNVMPLWKGAVPPRSSDHPLNSKSHFRLIGKDGKAQPLNEHYVTVNPVLPEVHAHITAVIGDIARRYPVDGIHLDYIRFIAESADDKAGYPADATSHRLFKATTGLDAEADPAAYRRFVADRITALVASIRTTVKSVRSRAVLTAAVWRNPKLGGGQYLQRYDQWSRQGLLDAIMPMIYTTDDDQFRSDLTMVNAIDGRAAVYPGIGVYKHEDPRQTVRQINLSRNMETAGVCLFAYESLFDSVNPEQDDSPKARVLRDRRLKAVREFLGVAPPPVINGPARP